MAEDKEATVIARRTLYLQIVTFAALLLGGVLGYFLVTRLDTTLKSQQIEKQDTPVVRILPNTDTWRFSDTIERVTTSLVIENGGYLPFKIGNVHVRVFEATPDGELATLLQSANDPPAGNQQPTTGGKLYAVSSADLSWSAIDGLSAVRNLNYDLAPGEKRGLSFRYLLFKPGSAKWYRFLITVNPHPDDATWTEHTVDSVISFAPPPPQAENPTVPLPLFSPEIDGAVGPYVEYTECAPARNGSTGVYPFPIADSNGD